MKAAYSLNWLFLLFLIYNNKGRREGGKREEERGKRKEERGRRKEQEEWGRVREWGRWEKQSRRGGSSKEEEGEGEKIRGGRGGGINK